MLVMLVGSIGVLALASGFFLTNIEHLLLIYLIYFSFVNGLYGQAENLLLQQHFAANRIGRIFGLGQSLAQGGAVLVSVGAGYYMDQIPAGYQHLFLASAFIAMMAMLLFATIKTITGRPENKAYIDRHFILSPLKKMVEILRERRDFFRFEISFMLYGIAFMMLLPVVPLYLVDDLHYAYSEIGIARGAITQLVMIGGVPLFGRIFDRTTPHRLAVWVFVALSIYPISLLAASLFEGLLRKAMVYFSFAWFGLTMSGLAVLWSLSSIRFSVGEDSGIFQSIHVAMTSIRACFAPILGFAIMTIFGKSVAMLASAALWTLAGVSVVYMRKYDIKSGAFRSLRAQKQ